MSTTAEEISAKGEEIFGKQEDLCPELAAAYRHAGGYPMVHHPLVVSFCMQGYGGALNRLLEQQRSVVAAALASGDMEKYVFAHARPYRIDALCRWVERRIVPHPDKVRKFGTAYWGTLASAWIDSENIDEEPRRWIALWNRPPKGFLPLRHTAMTEGELSTLCAMPEEITVYHGEERPNVIGWSWTTKRDVAEWFAERFTGKRKVYTGVVSKGDIVAYLDRRNEFEVIVDPKLVRDRTFTR